MKLIFASAAFTLGACVSMPSDRLISPSPSDLVGTWDVDLYFAADAPPSATVMEITDAGEAGTLSGTFYNSGFEVGRYRIEDDEIIISMITSDNSGPYATSGRLSDTGVIEGQTLSTGRDFLMAWRAEKR